MVRMAGKSSKGAMRFLTLKGQVWWFRLAIPEACRSYFKGQTTYLQTLDTGDIRMAKALRDEVEPEVRRLFAGIKAGTTISKPEMGAEERGALWRQTIAEADDDEGRWLAVSVAEDEAEQLRGKAREKFERALSGDHPIDHHLEDYLTEAGLAPKTTAERRGLVKRLARWCAEQGHRLPDIDRKTAGQYVTKVVAPMDPRTGKKHMTAIREYWRYLIRRGHVAGRQEDSPWLDQTMPDKGRRVERGDRDKERPFTETEIKTLVYSAWPEGMETDYREAISDAMRISALSGMRLAEIATLWVGETRDGVFDIQQGKTSAAARRVPIHPDLVEIVNRRTKGKGPKEWLFHEVTKERDAGDTLGKCFIRYRRHLGVDDTRPGKRRSLVNFHSFRRWFTTQARHAGQTVETIGDLIGHSQGKQTITFGVYTPGASEEQLKACVEAVRLPARR